MLPGTQKYPVQYYTILMRILLHKSLRGRDREQCPRSLPAAFCCTSDSLREQRTRHTTPHEPASSEPGNAIEPRRAALTIPRAQIAVLLAGCQAANDGLPIDAERHDASPSPGHLAQRPRFDDRLCVLKATRVHVLD